MDRGACHECWAARGLVEVTAVAVAYAKLHQNSPEMFRKNMMFRKTASMLPNFFCFFFLESFKQLQLVRTVIHFPQSLCLFSAWELKHNKSFLQHLLTFHDFLQHLLTFHDFSKVSRSTIQSPSDLCGYPITQHDWLLQTPAFLVNHITPVF